MAKFVIESANTGDMDLIRSDWRHSYRHSPRTSKWPPEAYAVFIADTMSRLLPRCSVLVARPPDWSAGVIGWIVAEQQPSRFVLHYAFTKPEFRKERVMTALIASLSPVGGRVFTHLRPPYSNVLRRSGFTWEPEAAK